MKSSLSLGSKGAIPLLLRSPFYLLVPFYAQQLFFPYLELNIPELRCIHHLFLQMLLDDFCQIPSPCLLVLFGNEWRTLLTIEGVPGDSFDKDNAKEWNGKTIDKKDVKTEQEIKKNTCLFLFLRLLIIK